MQTQTYPNLWAWKEELKKRPLFGSFVTFGNTDITEFTARMGFDFLVLDNEHGVMTQPLLSEMVRASQLAGVPAVVRCTENSYDHVQKALDFGANGVQVPLINTKEDAQKLVTLSNFPPIGNRGCAYAPRAAGYGMMPDKFAYRAKANETKLVCAHIETVQAYQNLDELLAVDGIDVYFLGPGDMSSSMNVPFGDPSCTKVIEDSIRRIAAAGKIAGTLVGNADAAKRMIDLGATYILTSINGYMSAGAAAFLDGCRK